jgi:hypothetical protein
MESASERENAEGMEDTRTSNPRPSAPHSLPTAQLSSGATSHGLFGGLGHSGDAPKARSIVEGKGEGGDTHGDDRGSHGEGGPGVFEGDDRGDHGTHDSAITEGRGPGGSKEGHRDHDGGGEGDKLRVHDSGRGKRRCATLPIHSSRAHLNNHLFARTVCRG